MQLPEYWQARYALAESSSEPLRIPALLRELRHLRNELFLLLNLCDASADACPILQAVSDHHTRKCQERGR